MRPKYLCVNVTSFFFFFFFFITAGHYLPGYDWTPFIVHVDYICDLFEAGLVILDDILPVTP